ncbi:polysaccharide pyruvyl transferase family protein [Sphingomonas faeni]|uniref:polysaccharide pyruvyl transferase family protein n=1 Tax=Sphingomonas faeni TaxID=185950 RepID=UPI00334FC84A
MTSRKPRILVISPAGRVVDHDNVEWYHNTHDQLLDRYFNIGDMVVFDSTLKLIDYAEVDAMEIVNPTDADIERYKGYDFAIVRASNFVHNGANFHRAAEIIEKIKIPVYCTGVGGQSADDRPYLLNAENLRFWQTVAASSNLIGVRGTFSAEVFYHNGIKNVEICGCPSIFRTRNPNLQIKPRSPIENIAVSLRREVSSTYTSDVAGYLSMQRNLLVSADDRYAITFTSHGEQEEKAFFFKDAARIERAEQAFAESGWFSDDNRDQMRDIYMNRHFFFLKVADYDRFIRSKDFAIGMRVHGVLPALANGVPAALIAYDSRSQELADTHAIPTLKLADAARMTAQEMIDSVSFDAFNKLYPLRYEKMKFIHEANGIPHRM